MRRPWRSPLRSPRHLATLAIALVLFAAPNALAGTGYTQVIYRDTAFSTQKTNYYCTAAVVQHIRNVATGESRRGRPLQEELYRFGRQNNRYNYKNRGVDPDGMVAMLEAYIPGSDWRVLKSKSFDDTLRQTALAMRNTNMPAVLFVGGGRHVWTMNGYTATADPAGEGEFTVTHVSFSGPYFPKQTAYRGWYDLAPNTRKTVAKFSEVFFPYKEFLAFGDHRNTPWNGWYVVIIPVSMPDPDPDPTPEPTPTAEPTEEPDGGPPPEAPAQPETTAG